MSFYLPFSELTRSAELTTNPRRQVASRAGPFLPGVRGCLNGMPKAGGDEFEQDHITSQNIEIGRPDL
jgi:hypothetical protein